MMEQHWYLPCPLFDTHFHSQEMARRGLDPDEILNQAFAKGLVAAVEVAIDEKDFDKRLDFVERHPGIVLTAGIHPSSSRGEHWIDRMDKVRTQLAHPLVRAIGETGLDFFHAQANKEEQKRAFRSQLELARETGLPIIIHNRLADTAVLELLEEINPGAGVLHCFTSDWAMAKRALDRGFYISFAGNLTYKKMDLLRDLATRLPLDRIVLETDAPFLSPQAVRRYPNHPGHIGYTLEKLAEIRKMDLEELALCITRNAEKLFKFSKEESK